MSLHRLAPGFFLIVSLLHATEPASAPPPLQAFAAVGSNFAQNTRLADLGWTDEQFDAFVEGLRATFRGRPYAFDQPAQQLHAAIGERLQALTQQAERDRLDFSQPGRVEAYMKGAIKQFHLQTSDTGLAFAIMARGGAERPGPDDAVTLTCEVVAADLQTVLEALSFKEQPRKVSELLPGIAEGVQMMAPGSSALVVVPPDLAYGDGPWPAGIPRGPLLATLTLHRIGS